MVKPSPWGGHQGNGWGSGGMSWGRDHRRGSGMGVPGSVSHASPLKKPFSSNVIAPPKFPRSGGSLGPKSWLEENMFRTDSNSNTLLPLQVNVLGCYCVNWCWWCCRIIVLCFVFASGWVWGGFFFFVFFFCWWEAVGFTYGNLTYVNLIICYRKRTKGSDEEACEKELNQDPLMK